jgi:hypothetical protein
VYVQLIIGHSGDVSPANEEKKEVRNGQKYKK